MTDYIIAPGRVLLTVTDPWVMPSGWRILTLFLAQSEAYADYGVHHPLPHSAGYRSQVAGCSLVACEFVMTT
jgi:hypothetical protein